MKKAIGVLWIITFGTILFGCNNSVIDKNPATLFVQGIQDGNKKKMYEAANLTVEIVNDSREKLIHPAQYKQTEQQRKDSEYALRISGEIDFISAKMIRMFPKSASFVVTNSKAKSSTDAAKNAVHYVKISYGNKEDAMTDKTNRPVKEMVIHLQQTTRTINGRPINEFSFNSEDFEKIADRNFEVLSYF